MSEQKDYKIRITEVLSRVISVQEEDKESALKSARQMYSDGEIVLDYSDFVYDELKFELISQQPQI